ncbi:MAG: hypothetical protein HGA84_02115, partial [Syntrophobacteraceae bacterium]|nr:hypothetical protein [Syntrophobacteraceae bacterium]
MAISVSSGIIFLGEMTASSPAIELVALELLTTGITQVVALPPEGHPVPFAWDAVPSATGAEVDAAGLRIAPIATQTAIGEVKVEEKSGHHVVTTGNRRIRTLKLNGLKYLPDGSDPVPIGSSAQLPANFRLVVTVPDGNGDWLPPLHSVPPVPGQGMLPQSLTGSSFE